MLHFQQSLKVLPSLYMQQGMRVLRASLEELTTYVSQQILLNPFLDLDPLNSDSYTKSITSLPLSSSLEHTHSLFFHLMNQAVHTFSDHEDLNIAQYILGNLSDDGLFSMSLQEISLLLQQPLDRIQTILKIIQKFDPIGIASASLQEYWLLVLNKKKYPQAFLFIKNYYPQLQSCDFPFISKKTKLPIPIIQRLLKQALASIPWSPANQYTMPIKNVAPPLPDVYLKYIDGQWEVKINAQGLPTIRLHQETLYLYDSLTKEEQRSLNQHILSAKWLLKHLKKREQTLVTVLKHIIPHQEAFLLGKQKAPVPLSVKTLAQELSLHESTIFRTMEHKALSTPIGIIPMKTLLPKAIKSCQCTSKEMILYWIRKWVQEEEIPLSDSSIRDKIQAQGISCARRTITKYRDQLQILPAHQRKKNFNKFYKNINSI